MRSLCYIRTMSLLLIIFQLDLFQRRGSLVLLYVFGPYIIEKALSKLELWLQRSESWPNGKKALHCSNSAIDVINFELLSIIVLIYHQPVIEPCSSLPSRPLPSPPLSSLHLPFYAFPYRRGVSFHIKTSDSRLVPNCLRNNANVNSIFLATLRERKPDNEPIISVPYTSCFMGTKGQMLEDQLSITSLRSQTKIFWTTPIDQEGQPRQGQWHCPVAHLSFAVG